MALVGVDSYSAPPARTMETEEIGLHNICRASVQNNNAKIIYASSSAVYGHAGGSDGLAENLVVTPVLNYGTAKRFNELYLASQYIEQKIPPISLRIFNVCGPGQDERLVIPQFNCSVLSGKALHIFGDGSQTRDFVYIDDVVNVALTCLDKVAECDVVNVCSGKEVAVRDLAVMIVRLSGSVSPVEMEAAPAVRTAFEVHRCFGSRDKLQKIVGPFTPLPLDVGQHHTIKWVRRSLGSDSYNPSLADER